MEMINFLKRVYYSNYYVWLSIAVITVPPICVFIFVNSFIIEPMISALIEIKDQYAIAKNTEISFSRENYLSKKSKSIGINRNLQSIGE